MKKLVLLFAVAIASLTSCNSDDDKNGNGDANGDGNGNGSGNGTKLTKSVVTSPQPSGNLSKINYTYDGTKIATSSSSSADKSVYSYTSDALTKIETKYNDITQSYVLYTYDKGDVKSVTTYKVASGKSDEKTQVVDYTYNEADKTQTATTTDYSNGVGTLSKTVTVNTYDAAHLLKSVTTTTIDDKNYTVIAMVNKYDDKNNPMVNVTGSPANIVKGSNNITETATTTVVTADGKNGDAITTQQTFSYDYDASGFPTLRQYFNAGKLTSSNEYFYQ